MNVVVIMPLNPVVFGKIVHCTSEVKGSEELWQVGLWTADGIAAAAGWTGAVIRDHSASDAGARDD
jgi:hypothetical protein